MKNQLENSESSEYQFPYLKDGWHIDNIEEYLLSCSDNSTTLVTKIKGRQKTQENLKGLSIQLGEYGAIVRDDAVDIGKITNPLLKLPSLDDATSFHDGYTIHTSALMVSMIRQRERFYTSRVIEYGAGNGALGLFSIYLGASHVTLIEREAKLCAKAQKLLFDSGIPDDAFSIVNDDVQNISSYIELLRKADIGIANLGHWSEYITSNGSFADMIVYESLRNTQSMHSFFTGGYGGYSIDDYPTTPWIYRQNENVLQAGYALLANGFLTIDHVDGQACWPMIGVTSSACAIR